MKILILLSTIIVCMYSETIETSNEFMPKVMNNFLKKYSEKKECLSNEVEKNNYSYCIVHNEIDKENEIRFTVYKINKKNIFNYIYCDEKEEKEGKIANACFIEEEAETDTYDFFKKRTIGLKIDSNFVYELAYHPNDK